MQHKRTEKKITIKTTKGTLTAAASCLVLIKIVVTAALGLLPN